jgi:diaminohydroxyphosphoribosylaminopyrimidine deaminase/5-amino-6-(5-phosphoribosylamino)uracil reductase
LLFGRLGARRLLLEGGPTLAASWLRAGAVDQVMAFVAPKILGGANAPGPIGGPGVATVGAPLELADSVFRRLGADLLVEGFLT